MTEIRRIEMIPKESVMRDIITPWTNSGRADNTKDGEFVFLNADSARVIDGTGIFCIKYGNKAFYYNVSDFYRIKVIWN